MGIEETIQDIIEQIQLNYLNTGINSVHAAFWASIA